MSATIEPTNTASDSTQFRYGTHYADGSVITRADELPWTPWGMPGTHFKLLDVNDDFGWFVFLLKVDAGTVPLPHKHYSAANAFTLQGWWGYEGRIAGEGQFIKEAGGITHAPIVGPEGTTMLGFGFGPIAGVDEKGNVTGVIDIDWMYAAAKANGAADHIVRKV